MADTRIVKIESILGSQIPEFLNSDSPLFKDFLKQYYNSQSHTTGVLDLANNLKDYKNISTYASDKLYSSYNECYLIEDILTFDDEIEVNSAVGFPSKYGLIQIGDEIITYTDIIQTEDTAKFVGCIRGFSGISKIDDTENITGLTFSVTLAEEHSSESKVKNLNLVFYEKLFQKFKSHYLPDFEDREFNPKIDLELILSRAKDFYLTKGTDTSFRILFEILYNDSISLIRPKEYIIRSSDDQYLITKNILVEPLFGTFTPSDIIGYTLTQELSSGVTASAAIYNIEYRPTDDFDLYEISLDSESLVYNFTPTKKTVVLEKLSDSLIVDSTIGFKDKGEIYIKDADSINVFTYSGKTINKFLNVSSINQTIFNNIKVGDEVIENNLVQITLDDTSIVRFRLLNVIENFDYSNTNTIEVGDTIFLSSFGENFADKSEFTSWIYNYPTYHEIQNISNNVVELKDSVRFVEGDIIELIDSNNVTGIVTTIVSTVISDRKITVPDDIEESKTLLKKKIIKSDYLLNEPVNIQNTYYNQSNNSLIVASSGLPKTLDVNDLNPYSFNIVGISSTLFKTKSLSDDVFIKHNLLSGNRIYVNSYNSEISTGMYFVKVVNDDEISLYKSSGDLYLSFAKLSNIASNSSPIKINNPSVNSVIGIASRLEYYQANANISNQLLLKEFKVEEAFRMNKLNSSSQIYNIEQAYGKFS
jgi:hypothetical protein